MTTITDTQLRVMGFEVLARAFGDVDAERFIALASSEPFDYTEWRRNHLFVGATVDSIMDEAEAMESNPSSDELPNETVDTLYDKIKAYSAAQGKRRSVSAQEAAR